ncbi:hypothetical protein ACFSCV_03875 [Methylopila henanensis]|uniref:Uncharacterized protein n=1 Tax=Methylopila henanensis TaxID=873516 RepID=A0ABW4K2B6_9HYPH
MAGWIADAAIEPAVIGPVPDVADVEASDDQAPRRVEAPLSLRARRR